MQGGGILSDERLADFCICQVHTISRFDAEYLARRWVPSHSFGRKARELKDRREHPLWQFLDPVYEENTKCRVVNTPVGYYVCGISTLLWNPFSAACRRCSRSEQCRRRTAARYPELYRLRIEERERRMLP